MTPRESMHRLWACTRGFAMTRITNVHRRNILHIPTSGLYARKGKPGRVAAARRRSSDAALCRLHHRRTLVPRCPITSPRWPRRPFIRTKASSKRENAVPTPSASNEGQVFKGGESSAADGEQHTGRAARAEGRCANGTQGLQTIKQDDPSAIGRRSSMNCSLQSAVSRRLSLS